MLTLQNYKLVWFDFDWTLVDEKKCKNIVEFCKKEKIKIYF
jgi:hypothetical protein